MEKNINSHGGLDKYFEELKDFEYVMRNIFKIKGEERLL